MYVIAPIKLGFAGIVLIERGKTSSSALVMAKLDMVNHYLENIMNKDQVKGRVEEVKGKVKEVAGRVLDDADMEIEGNVQKNVGKVQKGFGDLKEDIKKGH